MKLELSPRLARALVMFFLWTFIPLFLCTLRYHPFLGGYERYLSHMYEGERGTFEGMFFLFENLPFMFASPFSVLGLPEAYVFGVGLLITFIWIFGVWWSASYCDKLASRQVHLKKRLFWVSVSLILVLYGLPMLPAPILLPSALIFLIPAILIFLYTILK